MQKENGKRVSISKRQREAALGGGLLKLLCEIVTDGKLSDEEVGSLRSWVSAHAQTEAGLPALAYLSEAIERVLADGVITDSERTELHLAIEKVLPVSERGFAKTARTSAAKMTWKANREDKITRKDLEEMKAIRVSDREEDDDANDFPQYGTGSWRSDPMTEPQRNFIKSLGGTISRSATKGEASALIDRLLGDRPLSSRQEMILRFWGRPKKPEDGPREICAWMDEFYADDPDRKAAWELFKMESEDNGLQGDPLRVPLGCGSEYLARIKSGGEAAVPRFHVPPIDGIPLSRARTASPVAVSGARIPPDAAKPSRNGMWVSATLVFLVILAVWGIIAYKSAPVSATIPAAHDSDTLAADTVALLPPSKTEAVASADTKIVTKELTDSEKSLIGLREIAAEASVTGIVVLGGAPLIVIDGENYRAGDKLKSASGCVVSAIDTARRKVTFSDEYGNSVKRVLH